MGVGPSFPPRSLAVITPGSAPLQNASASTNTDVVQSLVAGVNTPVNLGPAGRVDAATGFLIGAGGTGPITNNTGSQIVADIQFTIIVRKVAAGSSQTEVGVFINGAIDPAIPLETLEMTSPTDPDTMTLRQFAVVPAGATIWPYIRSSTSDDYEIRGNVLVLRLE